jgi:hypothetical protein
MRKLLLSFLMATTAAAVTTPALAQRADRDSRAEERDERRAKADKARKERTEAREARPQRVEQPQQVDRAKPAERRQQNVNVREQRQDVRQQNVNVREQRQNVRQQNVDVRQQARDRRETNVNERGRPTLDQRQQSREALTQQRQQQRVDSRERYVESVNQRRVRPPANARPDRPAPPPPTATNHQAPTWSTTHWRSDRRYDWRRYRDRNRSHFRLGIYFDPFGWNYRRYNIGWRLWPSYYSQNYWLNDPYMYRLPYAPWPYKWVRYYDDALLVNVYTGQVADVIYDFFW